MSRLKVLKQRAARGEVGVCKLQDGWFVATGRGSGDCAGPFSRREAIQAAARWALPYREAEIQITMG
jgi:hypothetical protein